MVCVCVWQHHFMLAAWLDICDKSATWFIFVTFQSFIRFDWSVALIARTWWLLSILSELQSIPSTSLLMRKPLMLQQLFRAIHLMAFKDTWLTSIASFHRMYELIEIPRPDTQLAWWSHRFTLELISIFTFNYCNTAHGLTIKQSSKPFDSEWWWCSDFSMPCPQCCWYRMTHQGTKTHISRERKKCARFVFACVSSAKCW